MDGAAENFPDINFVIYHVGLPFLDEVCWQLIRFPNLYASLAATVNFVVRAPRQFAEVLGKLLFWCGEDKIIYGSEAPSWHPQWALKAFWEFELPQDLIDGYGYPQLTEQAKRKILGENLLRLHGMNVEQTVGAAAGVTDSVGEQLASASHPAWWLIGALSGLVVVLGLLASTAAAGASAARAAERLRDDSEPAPVI